MAPMKRSRVSSRRITIRARLSPALASACIRAFEAAVSAVSAPEKKAESNRQSTTTRTAIQGSTLTSAPPPCMSGLRQLRGEEVPHRTGIDAARDEAFADAARQDEGESAALDLLVLVH